MLTTAMSSSGFSASARLKYGIASRVTSAFAVHVAEHEPRVDDLRVLVHDVLQHRDDLVEARRRLSPDLAGARDFVEEADLVLRIGQSGARLVGAAVVTNEPT